MRKTKIVRRIAQQALKLNGLQQTMRESVSYSATYSVSVLSYHSSDDYNVDERTTNHINLLERITTNFVVENNERTTDSIVKNNGLYC